MERLSRQEIASAADLVRTVFPATPQTRWPLLARRLGAAGVVVKHENAAPTGAFKVRGGLTYVERLRHRSPEVRGIISATRGNHGQSLAFAGTRAGLKVTIYVPHGNSTEKNAAMRAYGAELVEYGIDFDEARVEAMRQADDLGYHAVPSFHRDLVRGVSTYSYELLSAFTDLDVLYVPIGMGSGICGAIAARDAMGLKTRIVGVQAEGAPSYALSFKAGHVVPTERAVTLADGLATRAPDAEALAIIRAGADDVVTVSDAGIAEAIRVFWADTHMLAEGAGAAGLAAALAQGGGLAGRQVGLVLSGGNIDLSLFQSWVLNGQAAQA